MPLTIAHAVVAPPLAKLSGGRAPVSALAIGAMAPDFMYLLFLDTDRNIGHSALGILLFCLPVSIAVLVLWHGVVKRPLAGLLPDRWSHVAAAVSRPYLQWSVRMALATVTAVTVGAGSHVAWDFVTHDDGAASGVLPGLQQPLLGHALYAWLQYGCSVAGTIALGIIVVAWARRQPRVAVSSPPLRLRIVGAASIAAFTVQMALANIARIAVIGGSPTLRTALTAAALGAMAGGAVAVTAYGFSQAGRGTAPA